MTVDGSRGAGSGPDVDRTDRSASELDDELDRDEIRLRYYNLMQELRVLLPGVQILVAFLLTAPFAARFAELDRTGRALYGVAMGAGTVSIISFATPTAIHRVGRRRSRSSRLVWSIRLLRIGLTFFGVSLTSALTVVTRLVSGDAASWLVGGACLALVVIAWIVLPYVAGRDRDGYDT
jgi:hypothetical protein